MNYLQKTTTHIKTNIDRVDITTPIGYYETFLGYYKRNYIIVDENGKYDGDYFILEFLLPYGEVQLTSLKYNSKKKHPYERFFINLSDPCPEIQENMVSDLSRLVKNSKNSRNNPIISQLEVSFDFYTKHESDLIGLMRYIEHHFVFKYARPNSYKNIEETWYFGKNGDIRYGRRGGRCYIKEENGEKFCRFEVQFNQAHLREAKITYDMMPFNPLNFQSLDYVEILDNFTPNSTKNISRTIMKNQDILPTSPDYNSIYRKMYNKIKKRVLGPGIGAIPAVHEQLDSLKELRKKFKFSENYKSYFPKLLQEKELVCCLACIGYEEENCSKRLVLCQGFDD